MQMAPHRQLLLITRRLNRNHEMWVKVLKAQSMWMTRAARTRTAMNLLLLRITKWSSIWPIICQNAVTPRFRQTSTSLRVLNCHLSMKWRKTYYGARERFLCLRNQLLWPQVPAHRPRPAAINRRPATSSCGICCVGVRWIKNSSGTGRHDAMEKSATLRSSTAICHRRRRPAAKRRQRRSRPPLRPAAHIRRRRRQMRSSQQPVLPP
uniref:Uncharacterized protein n=1 Tax=Mesocestoides corti TaxID=53468 RepID=A0A5K3G478_MESCO